MKKTSRLCILAILLAACGASDDTRKSPARSASEHLYVTNTVVLGEDGETSYVSLLPDLDVPNQKISLSDAREFAGWSGAWGHEDQLFVSDGESPTMMRFSVTPDGALRDERKLNFMNYGVEFAEGVFVSPDKAYAFSDEGIIWDPTELEITGTFALPEVEDRPNGMDFAGVGTGRQLVVRGNRTYVATHWANWDDYAVSEDSLIVVIDNEKDEVVDLLPAACPYLDVATLDEEGNLYFSNWVYSVGQTLLEGKKKACAVRIRAGEEQIDEDWTLTFADVTDGREAAVLRAVGNHKALISVYYDERVEIADDTTAAEVGGDSNWRFWTLDLETREASPVDNVDFNAGGSATARIDDRGFLLVPNDDYASTTVYEILADGSAEKRWEIGGWSMTLFKLR